MIINVPTGSLNINIAPVSVQKPVSVYESLPVISFISEVIPIGFARGPPPNVNLSYKERAMRSLLLVA